MKTQLRFAVILMTISLLSGCAQLEEMQCQESIQNAQQNCTQSAAYASGVNTAMHDQSMQINYTNNNQCSLLNLSQKELKQINNHYISGYQFGLKNRPKDENINIHFNHHHSERAKWECIDNFGQQICGYHCKKSGTLAICAKYPDQECIAKFGAGAACGYGCVATDFKVACADKRGYACMTNNFNQITCGKHCTKNIFGQVKCEKYQ